MMYRVMAEPHLELVVENLQFGADLVHRAFIHLHEVNEFNDLFGSEGASRKIQRFETGLQIGGFESAMSVKYHVHQYTRRIPDNLDVRGESFQEPIFKIVTTNGIRDRSMTNPADRIGRYE